LNGKRYGEVQAAEFPKDFIHGLRISLKELGETQRRFKRIQHLRLIKNGTITQIKVDEFYLFYHPHPASPVKGEEH
jgi:hypothetical protein